MEFTIAELDKKLLEKIRELEELLTKQTGNRVVLIAYEGEKVEKCDRCSKETRTTIMSMLNMDIICPECKQKERSHPLYKVAAQIEHEQVKKGNRNYPGLLYEKKSP